MPDVVVRGECDALRFQHGTAPSATRGVSTVDLRHGRWFTPSGLVAICAFIDRHVRLGDTVRFHGPTDPNISAYLFRMRLGALLEDMGVSHDLRAVATRTNSSLVELHSFGSEKDVSRLALHIQDSVAPNDTEAAKALHRCLTEAGENVKLHSGLENGFLAAQTTRGRGQARILRFAVGDGGQGFRTNLHAQGASSDLEALRLGVVQGVSSTGGVNRGRGLQELLRLIRGQGGVMSALSGKASLTWRGERETPWTYGESFGGALVEGVVPLRE